MNPTTTHRIRFTVANKFGVDPNGGKLTNLQLMAAGREAKGHGIYIDERTIETGAEAVANRGGRLKAYVTHNHAGPCSYMASDMADPANELNIPGFFSGISAELKAKPAQLVAAEFEFYDAFKKNYGPQYEQLLEMAKKTPDLLGLSVECWGYVVYVGADGTEYSGEPDGVDLLYNGMPALRITDMWAAAFVSDGAATDGLFAKLSRLFGGKQDQHAELAAALLRFAEEFAAGTDEVRAGAPSIPPSHSNSLSHESTMKIIADLKAKLGSNPQTFAAAMAIVGNTPADQLASLTVGAVETQLAIQETQNRITALTAERDQAATLVTTLTAERDQLRGQVTTLTAERNEWKTKFEALKGSGHGGGVNLGTGGGGAPDSKNPFAAATINYTEQALLMKTDPVRAAALKAAAQN
jgi:hypothetical protein